MPLNANDTFYYYGTTTEGYSSLERTIVRIVNICFSSFLIATNFLFNITVVIFLLVLYFRQRRVARRCLHCIPMLVCCVVHVIHGVADGLNLPYSVERETLTCRMYIRLLRAINALSAVGFLLVAAVFATKTVRILHDAGFKIMAPLTFKFQKVLVGTLLIMAVVWPVLLYLVFIKKLENFDLLCTGSYSRWSHPLVPIATFIVPAFLAAVSCVLVVVAYVLKKRRRILASGDHGADCAFLAETTASHPVRTSDTRANTDASEKTACNDNEHLLNTGSSATPDRNASAAASAGQPSTSGISSLELLPRQQECATGQAAPPLPATAAEDPQSHLHDPYRQRSRAFPFNAIIAGVVCFAYGVLWIPVVHLGRVDEGERIVLADRMLDMLIRVVVPVCWVLDADIRALWCCGGCCCCI